MDRHWSGWKDTVAQPSPWTQSKQKVPLQLDTGSYVWVEDSLQINIVCCWTLETADARIILGRQDQITAELSSMVSLQTTSILILLHNNARAKSHTCAKEWAATQSSMAQKNKQWRNNNNNHNQNKVGDNYKQGIQSLHTCMPHSINKFKERQNVETNRKN